MNEMAFIATIPTVSPNERTFVGSTSTVQMNDSDRIPMPEMKMTNAKLVTGTHVSIDKSYPSESQNRYAASINWPIVQPTSETVSRIFLPSVSTNFADTMVPMTWTTARIIDDASVDKFVPDFSNITEPYEMNR